jgi:hypothetical protein
MVSPARYQIRLTTVTSIIVMTRRSTQTVTGTLTELEARYRKVAAHNLALGWWGIPFGIVWTPMALVQNARALRKLRQLAGQGNPSGPSQGQA